MPLDVSVNQLAKCRGIGIECGAVPHGSPFGTSGDQPSAVEAHFGIVGDKPIAIETANFVLFFRYLLAAR